MSSDDSDVRTPAAGEEHRFELFTLLFAIYIVSQFLYFEGRGSPRLVGVPALGAAVGLLLHPRSVTWFLVACGAEFFHSWSYMPVASNHTFVELLFIASVILSYLGCAWSGRTLHVSAEALSSAFVPAGRSLLALLYLFATWHKLNTDYLIPEASCAVFLMEGLPGGSLVARLPGAIPLAIYGSLVVEALLGCLLAIRRTRRGAVVLGVAFHLLLGVGRYDLFVPFSTLCISLLLLSLPTQCARLVVEGGIARVVRHLPRHTLGLIIIVVTIGLIEARRFGYDDLIRTLFVLGALSLLYSLIVAVRVAAFAPEDELRGTRIGTKIRAVVLLVCLVNGFAPYLGVKTHQSFNMFSNLRTEGGTTNHLLIPKPIYLSGALEDLVTIDASSDPLLARVAEEKLDLTYSTFRAMLARNPDSSVTYERRGSKVSLARASSDPELVRPDPYLATKLLTFLPIPRLGWGEPLRCDARDRYIDRPQ